MSSRHRATIRVFGANKRADVDAQRLLCWIEDFVNVGNSPADYERFAATHDSFWPIGLHDGGSGKDLAWTPEAHKLFLAYRDCLGRVWSRDKLALDNVELAFLLGMQPHGYFDPGGFGVPEFVRTAWAALPNAHCSMHTWVAPVWNVAEFVFYPHNDFQKAVYRLFRDSWRARTCEECCKCFIADKSAQRFCSSRCFGKAKRKRDLAYWRHYGAERRKSRKNASRGSRQRQRASVLRKPRRLRSESE